MAAALPPARRRPARTYPGGRVRVTDAIPTEAQLSQRYRASRITVRHALDLLDQEGLVHREQGRGSFVRPRAIAVGPRRLTSFTQELRERGVRCRGRSSSRSRSCSVPLDAPLDLTPSRRCVRLERIRRADGRPIAHQVTLPPGGTRPGHRGRLSQRRLAVRVSCGRGTAWTSIARMRHTESVAADAAVARLLGIAAGTPVFIVERVGFAGARRIEWTDPWSAATTTRCTSTSSADRRWREGAGSPRP